METLNVTVAGSYKEKALLTSIIADQLNVIGINVSVTDTCSDNLVREKFEDLVSEFQETETTILLTVEKLHNANVVTDLTKLYNELSQLKWAGEDEGWNSAITSVKESIGQILLI